MKKVLLIILGILIVILIAGNMYNSWLDKKYGIDDTKKNITLNSKLNFDGSLLMIKNNDTFDYDNVTLKINDDYELNVAKIPAGKYYNARVIDFSNSNSERFTYDKKPKELTLIFMYNGEYALAKWKLNQ